MKVSMRLDPAFTRAFGRFASRAEGIGKLSAKLGQVMARDWTRHIFRNNNWRAPGGRAGAPLLDTRRLSSSVAWRSTPSRTEVYTRVPYGAIHNGQRGLTYTVRPKRAKSLAVPNPQKLGAGAFRGAQPADYQGLVARNGWRGFGLYLGRAREPHFFLKRSVVIRARPYLYWTATWIGRVVDSFRAYVTTGQWSEFGRSAQASGGTPDVGRRGGGRP